MKTPDPLVLGDLFIEGAKIRFQSVPPKPVPTPAGPAVPIGIRYQYEEGSTLKESTRVKLELKIMGQPVQEADVFIKDKPVLRDEQWGFLAVRVGVAEAGLREGEFVVRVTYEAAPWGGGKGGSHKEFLHHGRFSLDVQ